MFRPSLVLLAAVGLAGAALLPAAAQPAPAATPAPTQRQTESNAAPVTAAQAQQALAALNDPAKRAQLAAILQTLARAVPTPASAAHPAPASSAPPPSAAGTASATTPLAAPAVPPALPLAPDSLGAQLLVGVSSHLSSLSDSVLGTAGTLADVPVIATSLVELATDPWSQQQFVQTAWRLVVVMLAGLAVQFLMRRLLARPSRALAARARAARQRLGEPAPEDFAIAEAEAGQTEPHRRRLPALLLALRHLPYALSRLVLNLLPPLAMAAVGDTLVGAGLATDEIPRLVVLGVLHAYVVCRVCTSISRALAGPCEPRLLPVSDSTGLYVLRWVRRIAAISVFGYTIDEIGLLFGLSFEAHAALLKLVTLAVDLCLIVIVVQKRAVIAGAIRARPGATGALALLRNRTAAIWHIIAILYLAAFWVAWAVNLEGGASRILFLVIVSIAIGLAGRLLGSLVILGLERASHVPAELAERYPGLESRLGAYHPMLRVAVRIVVGLLMVLALLQAWGWSAVNWVLASPLGQQLLSAGLTTAVTLVAALLVWEGANGLIQRRLGRLAREGQLGRAARLRTLLPMLRTALFITVGLFTVLTVLSQIGVNIAPLLAGAGVVGLAIGFGSQKLVQDIITGLFLLLENAMQVGDTISLANLTGTVENLSVRTIRLRAVDGAVHIIPFSAVTSVTNMSRDYAYAVLDIEAGLNEEPDRIAQVLRDIAGQMRAEPRWQRVIFEDLDVMGVDKFIENAWVLRVRMKVEPRQRLAVQRELNRRVKYRFDELAIESPFTSFTALKLHQPPEASPAPLEAAPTTPTSGNAAHDTAPPQPYGSTP